MNPSNPHLVVATPCYGGQLAGPFFFSLLNLQAACAQLGLPVTVLLSEDEALITRARQDLAAKFLGIPGATHLLFIDADIQFAPEQVFRLLKFDAEVTAAAYPLKRIDWQRVKALAREGRDRLETAVLRYVVELENPPVEKNGFGLARYAGTGFLMIRRPALLRMAERYPESRYGTVDRKADPLAGSPHRFALFDCLVDEKNHEFLSEDYSFCRRWTEMGGEIWVDLRSRLTHMGQVNFEGDFALREPGEGKGAP